MPAATGPFTGLPPVNRTTTTSLLRPTSLNDPNHPRCVRYGTRSGLAENGFVVVVVRAPGGAVLDRAMHARLDLRKPLGDIQVALDARNELANLLLGAEQLQVVKRAAVGYGHQEPGEFQRRDRDALSEAGHHPHASNIGGRGGKNAGIFTFDVQPGALAQSEKFGIVGHALVSELHAEAGEVRMLERASALVRFIFLRP